jgi:hypothetical protein
VSRLYGNCGRLVFSQLYGPTRPVTGVALPLPYKKYICTFVNAIYSSVVMEVFLMVTARNNCGTIAVRCDKFGAVEDYNISWNCIIAFLSPDILFKKLYLEFYLGQPNIRQLL